jgi:uncharacterized membrane protein
MNTIGNIFQAHSEEGQELKEHLVFYNLYLSYLLCLFPLVTSILGIRYSMHSLYSFLYIFG